MLITVGAIIINSPNHQSFFSPFSPPHQKQNSSPSYLPSNPHRVKSLPGFKEIGFFLLVGFGEKTSTMSLLPPEVHAQLSQLLRALGTPDNAVRSQAEDQLNNEWVQNKPDVLLMGLAEQIGGAEDTLVSAIRL